MSEEGAKKTSIYLLILANILVVIMAVLENWSFGNMLWVYWFQSVIIGIFHFFRLLFFKGKFGEQLIRLNDPRVSDGLKNLPSSVGQPGNVFMALFFAVHYGFFHYGYSEFLPRLSGQTLFDVFITIWPAVLIFAINHLISLIISQSEEKSFAKTAGEFFAEPYVRIMPMHLIIMIYGFLSFSYSGLTTLPWGQTIELGQFPQIAGIVIFAILKIYADVVGHNKKHGSEMPTGLFNEVNDKLKSGEIKAINAKDIEGEDLAKMLNDWDKKSR